MKTTNQKFRVQNVAKHSIYLGLFLSSVLLMTSCQPDDPEVVNEEEVITTVITTLKSGENTITLQSKDADGDGPMNPTVTVSGILNTNTAYTGTVSFLNELVNPATNISEEVLKEGVDHQLFFQAPTAFGNFVYNDTDVNGKPIGLSFTFTTGASVTSGNLIITLRHEPNKSASGVAGGSIVNAGGATDAEVIYYPIVIEN